MHLHEPMKRKPMKSQQRERIVPKSMLLFELI